MPRMTVCMLCRLRYNSDIHGCCPSCDPSPPKHHCSICSKRTQYEGKCQTCRDTYFEEQVKLVED